MRICSSGRCVVVVSPPGGLVPRRGLRLRARRRVTRRLTRILATPAPAEDVAQTHAHALAACARGRDVVRGAVCAGDALAALVAALLAEAAQRGDAFVGGGVGARAEGEHVAEVGVAAGGGLGVGLKGRGEGAICGVWVGGGGVRGGGAEVDAAGGMVRLCVRFIFGDTGEGRRKVGVRTTRDMCRRR